MGELGLCTNLPNSPEQTKKTRGGNMNERKRVIEEINNLSHEEMARLWRFVPSGHTFFDADLPYYTVFAARFEELGGMTPTLSKVIGW